MMNRITIINGMRFEKISSFRIPPLLGDEFICRSNGDGIYFSSSIKKVLSLNSDEPIDNTNNKIIFTGTETPEKDFSIVLVSFNKKLKKVFLIDIFENYCRICKKRLNDILLSQAQACYYFVNDLNNSKNQSTLILSKSDERRDSENGFIIFNGINIFNEIDDSKKFFRVEIPDNRLAFKSSKNNLNYFLIVPD